MTADTVDEERGRRTLLDGIAFLTGEDPSAGAFLLVVGMTTCVFIARFQLAFPAPVSYILTALVVDGGGRGADRTPSTGMLGFTGIASN